MNKINTLIQNLPNEARVFALFLSLFILAAAMLVSVYYLEA